MILESTTQGKFGFFQSMMPEDFSTVYESVGRVFYEFQKSIIPWVPTMASHSFFCATILVGLIGKTEGKELDPYFYRCVGNCLAQYCARTDLILNPVRTAYTVASDEECAPFMKGCFDKCDREL